MSNQPKNNKKNTNESLKNTETSEIIDVWLKKDYTFFIETEGLRFPQTLEKGLHRRVIEIKDCLVFKYRFRYETYTVKISKQDIGTRNWEMVESEDKKLLIEL